jgi:hypothetical protein
MNLPDLSFPKSKIHVSDEIIAKACQGNKRYCMIAEAIRTQVKGATAISVDLMTIRYSNLEKGLRYIFHTPRTAQIALMNFDGGNPISPFSFRLRGGQIVTMVKRGEHGKGETQRHNLGRRKISTRKEANGGVVTETVGGESPPKLSPHPSHQSIRKFGLGGFTRPDGTVLGWTGPKVQT